VKRGSAAYKRNTALNCEKCTHYFIYVDNAYRTPERLTMEKIKFIKKDKLYKNDFYLGKRLKNELNKYM
jgi:ribosomal protein L33